MNALRRLFVHLDEESEQLKARITRLTERWKAPKARDAICALLADDDVWETLRFNDREGLCLTVDGPEVLHGELRAEALRSLLTACLAAHTRNLAAHTRSKAHAEEADG